MGNRRVQPDDYARIAVSVIQCIDTVRLTNDKAIAKRLDEEAVMAHIISSPNAWLVDDAFLVVYSVVTPWYAPRNSFELREELVLRLDHSDKPFSLVPEFLAQRAEAEGVVLTAVGTALARSDDALAAKYEQHGFLREATLLTKES
jgi:hypothetical protein